MPCNESTLLIRLLEMSNFTAAVKRIPLMTLVEAPAAQLSRVSCPPFFLLLSRNHSFHPPCLPLIIYPLPTRHLQSFIIFLGFSHLFPSITLTPSVPSPITPHPQPSITLPSYFPSPQPTPATTSHAASKPSPLTRLSAQDIRISKICC